MFEWEGVYEEKPTEILLEEGFKFLVGISDGEIRIDWLVKPIGEDWQGVMGSFLYMNMEQAQLCHKAMGEWIEKLSNRCK